MGDLGGVRRALRAQLAPGEDDGRLVEEVYRVGGRYDREIRRIVGHLDGRRCLCAAAAWPTRLRALIRFYDDRRRGRPRGLRHRLGARPGRRRSTRSTVSSRCTSTRAAPRAPGRAWSATSTRRRRGASRRWPPTRSGSRITCRGIRGSASPRCTGVTAKAIEVVIETGDSGPVTPIGINLPERSGDPRTVRQQVGVAGQRQRGLRAIDARGMRIEFSWDDAEAARAKQWGGVRAGADDRHARGDRPRVRPDGRRGHGAAARLLKEQYSAIEETRADLVALYFLPDPKLVELGLVPAEDHDADRAGRVRAVHAQRRWCSCAASARARSSKKTTCATGR